MITQLANILKDSNYKLTQFSKSQVQELESRIAFEETRGKTVAYVTCLVRNKKVQLKPEEVVRQLYLDTLINQYSYPKNRIILEKTVHFGSDSSKRADIVILDKERDIEYIIVELKKPDIIKGKEQLKSYCNGTGAPMGIWTNGDAIEYYFRKDPNVFDELPNIPTFNQTLKDIFDTPFTILDLVKMDKLKKQSLQEVIKAFEDEVLANAGVDIFEEAFKLIFAKLYDETLSSADKQDINSWLKFNKNKRIEDYPQEHTKDFRNLLFRNTGVESDTYKQITDLFEQAKEKWTGIFQESDKIKLTQSHLQTCVSYLEDVKLFNSNMEVVDDAFEYLVNKDAKGDKGQYFTPRYVIDMCVKMLNPQPHEYMIDTASGSCGFPVHTIFYVWQQMRPDSNPYFTLDEKNEAQKEYVRSKVFALDFDEKAARVGRTLNLIAGDGETNVLQINSLDFDRWVADFYDQKTWRKQYGKGFENLEKLRTKTHRNDESYKYFNFDIVMANPPFAGEIKNSRLIQKYDLGKNDKDKWIDKVSRDILFVERNLNMLKPGGRTALVLPQGRFNNSSDKRIREYIAEHCRILAVVGLHGNTFKPHTGTKTSVIFLQKWNDDPEAGALCPKLDDYPIFFATMQKTGKDNSGDKIHLKNELGEKLLDIAGHPVVEHDLFKIKLQNGEYTADGIAEAFDRFAQKQGLSFAKKP